MGVEQTEMAQLESSNARSTTIPGTRRELVTNLVLLTAVSIGLLAVFAQFIDTSRLHISLLTFNDQVGYVSTARRLLDTGILADSLVYPSTLLQKANQVYLYMPGHYFTLALSYKLLGYGSWQSMLPNLVAMVISTLCVYLIARRWYSNRVAWTAALLLMLFPASLIYAFSAMSELTRVAAVSLALCIFVYLPRRWQPWIGPLLIAPAVLFRETSALLVLPMGVLVLNQDLKANWKPALLFAGVSVIVVLLILVSPPASGRPSLMAPAVFDPTYQATYSDAVLQHALTERSVLSWGKAIGIKFLKNIPSVLVTLVSRTTALEILSTGLILLGMLLGGVIGLRERNVLFQAAAIFALGVWLICMTLLGNFGFDWLRMMLVTVPLLVIVLAVLLGRFLQSLRDRWGQMVSRVAGVALAGGLALVSVIYVNQFFAASVVTDAEDFEHVRWLEEIQHDDSQMLVSDVKFIAYAYEHYPVRWAFVPANGRTLDLLAIKYEIGTVVLPERRVPFVLSPDDFARNGLYFAGNKELDGQTYSIFKRQVQ